LHIHLTSLTHDLTNIAMQVAMDSYREHQERDPITGLTANTSAGRPDWDLIFSAVAAAHPHEPVDVFFCGPPALGTDVKRNCRKHGLAYHAEKF
jgi:predicted ferric reductase